MKHALPLEGNSDIQRFRYFGNELLDGGGEIGFHGYNHMPLVLENFDYGEEFESYKQWESEADIRGALQELEDFCTLAYPEEEFQVYVPPSNILSKKGGRSLRRISWISKRSPVFTLKVNMSIPRILKWRRTG